METESFSIVSCVCGYHVYGAVWQANFGDILACETEYGNIHDPYAVAVVSNGTVVGHVPRNISATSHLFIRRGGSITCQVTGNRRYSSDLAQGGLEIPCDLNFSRSGGLGPDMEKFQQLLKEAPSIAPPKCINTTEPPSKKKKFAISSKEKNEADSSLACSPPSIWLTVDNWFLTIEDKESIYENKILNDRHINISQYMLRKQFPEVEGLICTLYQHKKSLKQVKSGVQIIHDQERNHWLVASTINSPVNVIDIYDSLFDNITENTEKVICNVFASSGHKINVKNVQKQVGGKDCGLFALATVTAILHGIDIRETKFYQTQMRHHFVCCLENKLMISFPAETEVTTFGLKLTNLP